MARKRGLQGMQTKPEDIRYEIGASGVLLEVHENVNLADYAEMPSFDLAIDVCGIEGPVGKVTQVWVNGQPLFYEEPRS